MAYQHGVYIQENPTSITPPLNADSGVQVVVGTAPINLTKNPEEAVNKPILVTSWKEAIENLGYSDDWEKYTLCEVMDFSLRRIGVAPIVFINVLDPKVHKKSETVTLKVNKDDETIIPNHGVLLNSIKVKDAEDSTTYVEDVDYTVSFNDEDYPALFVFDGNIKADSEVTVEFDVIAPSLAGNEDVIGGYDSETETYTGLELIDQVYPRLGIIPCLIYAPGYTQNIEVASIVDAKSELINGSFNSLNVLDIDSETIKSYQDVPEWKKQNSYTSERSILGWPKAKLGDKIYWMSTVIAGTTAYTDTQNDNVPYVSPSNKKLPINATVLTDGKEVYLDQNQANFLNGEGVVTAINMNGWRLWGNNTAAYPNTTDPKDRFIPIRRVFDWWGNTFILTYFDKVDDPANYRLIENVVDSENIRGNGFQAKGQIAGARIEFRRGDNPMTNILDGRIEFIQKIGAFPPAKNIVNVLEFDPTMVENALHGGE